MTKEAIRQMALECGLTINGNVMLGVERFAKLVAAHEREFCALTAEDHAIGIHGHDKHGYADAIRARGDET